MNTMNWLLSSLCFLGLLSSLSAQKTSEDPCNQHPENAIRLNGPRENSTCGFISGRIEICNGRVWKAICDSDWTRNDAAVACRELGYSAIEANVSLVSLSIHVAAPTVPECEGTETNISSCPNTTRSNSDCATVGGGVTCFLNDSSPDICFSVPTTPTNPGTDDTMQTPDLIPTQDATTSPITTETTAGTTEGNFLTSPLGISVIVVIVVVVIFVVILFVVVILVVCKKSPSSKLEPSRVSPQNLYLEDSLKLDSDKFNNSPDQRRRTNEQITISEHHLLEQSPLYEQVKDVAPPSISSHDSGRSTDASENNAPPVTYSTLERDPTLPHPTYSTLDGSQADYAQVQPYFNGSLTRGATLTSPVTEDLYHTLDRTTSQSSYTRDQYRSSSMSSSPKARGSKPNSSPKQTPRTVLPSITDSEEIPTYAVLEEAVDEAASMVSTSAVVSQRLSPHHSPSIIRHSPSISRHSPSISRHSPSISRHSPSISRYSPEHSHLQHTRSYALSARPTTHEHTMLPNKQKQKSSTLPHSGRSAPSVPPTRHRHSGYVEEQHNGVKTFMDGRLNASTQDTVHVTSWV